MRVKGDKSNPGPRDYLRAVRKRGLWHTANYFFNAHLFDLRHGTDTNVWLWRQHFTPPPPNIDHGVCYMASWTSEIRRSFRFLAANLEGFSSFAFVDVGCGKGKAVLVWQRQLDAIGSTQAVHGIDHYSPLIDVARRNHSKVFGRPGDFACADAAAFDFGVFGPRLILYLYNPFDEEILGNVLRRVSGKDVCIVYTNPVHADAVAQFGYAPVYEHRGWFPITHTKIFASEGAMPGAAFE